MLNPINAIVFKIRNTEKRSKAERFMNADDKYFLSSKSANETDASGDTED